jgi:hypothetical protein
MRVSQTVCFAAGLVWREVRGNACATRSNNLTPRRKAATSSNLDLLLMKSRFYLALLSLQIRYEQRLLTLIDEASASNTCKETVKD